MNAVLLAALGGAIGSSARYGVSLALLKALGPAFPWGTLCVNVLGGVAMGALFAVAGQDRAAMVFFGTGMLGGFTTFSAFSLETAMMIERGALLTAAAYAFGSVTSCVAAMFLGLFAARSFAS